MLSESIVAKQLLTPTECENLIRQGLKKDLASSEVFDSKGKSQNNEIRSCRVTEVTSEPMRDYLFSQISTLNSHNLKLEISGMEPLQLLRYQVDDFYTWHTDWSPNNNKKRKLSFSVQLSDPSTYEGGDLELFRGPETDLADRTQGVLTLFPSWTLHRVNRLSSGERWALVGWITGKPIK